MVMFKAKFVAADPAPQQVSMRDTPVTPAAGSLRDEPQGKPQAAANVTERTRRSTSATPSEHPGAA